MQTQSQQSLADGLALVLSNLALLPAIVVSLLNNLFPEAIVLSVLLFTSSFYHICQSGFACLYPFDALQIADHFYVYTVVVWITLFFIGLKLRFRFIIAFIIQAALFPAVIVYLHSWAVAGILIGSLVVVVILILSLTMSDFPKIDWLDLTTVILLIGGGFGLHVYAGDPGSPNYAVSHSIWHILSMIAVFFIIEMKIGDSLVARTILYVRERWKRRRKSKTNKLRKKTKTRVTNSIIVNNDWKKAAYMVLHEV